ncbi:uncharacterized protein DS421_20g695170 [Arachis hypogaea]|nr:uncharacterized protein DS421_20g695170 [Arachis hypogaea]
MTLSREGHIKASRNGLIFGRLLRFFFSVISLSFFFFFLRCADLRSLNDAIPRRTHKGEP